MAPTASAGHCWKVVTRAGTVVAQPASNATAATFATRLAHVQPPRPKKELHLDIDMVLSRPQQES
ncbi:hypothetical protein GCM10009097_15550 [Pigmentiphaga daeguensis]|uniref:Uncharacterized protein n=1 Tax=Pigmentiphaga daeguensis TaxID=414049 RepID=A0ABN1BKR0_9BURK